MKSDLVQLQGLCFGYETQNYILKDLDLQIDRDSKVAVIGDNGQGKTTLLHIIMGLQRPQQGRVFLFGMAMQSEKDFASQRTKMGFVFQDADDQLFCPTVLEDVCFGPLNQGLSREEALQLGNKTLQVLGLEGYQERLTHKLSGGEKKLVSLATVLSMNPQMLILDEPTTGLDKNYRQKFIELIKKIDLPHLIVSHDFDFLDQTSQEFYLMHQGRLESGTRTVVHSHQHAHPLGDTSHGHDHYS